MTGNHSAWEKVQLARHAQRPTAKLLIHTLAPDFLELKGDRCFANDDAIVGGIGTIDKITMTIIAEEKGTTLEEKIRNHFGMPHPEGYRKVMRLVRQAEKFSRPILFLIDTPGAYPGFEAESRGQAEAIASLLRLLFTIKTPIIAVVLSEGGSGGALAIGIADYILMLENATYSILSPEGFAAILYKDASLANKVADDMKLTADDLFAYGIIDEIIPEAAGGWHIDNYTPLSALQTKITEKARSLLQLDPKTLLENRQARYRRYGIYVEDKT
ncbi:MAG: acetyl-CoA carboxylase carboxyl transferase subunit alpha [Bacilli bacterium]|nr:acetyl-CoA carboxylase carboxyl transferase subunit alpha [Bacilli bacterium]